MVFYLQILHTISNCVVVNIAAFPGRFDCQRCDDCDNSPPWDSSPHSISWDVHRLGIIWQWPAAMYLVRGRNDTSQVGLPRYDRANPRSRIFLCIERSLLLSMHFWILFYLLRSCCSLGVLSAGLCEPVAVLTTALRRCNRLNLMQYLLQYLLLTSGW